MPRVRADRGGHGNGVGGEDRANPRSITRIKVTAAGQLPPGDAASMLPTVSPSMWQEDGVLTDYRRLTGRCCSFRRRRPQNLPSSSQVLSRPSSPAPLMACT